MTVSSNPIPKRAIRDAVTYDHVDDVVLLDKERRRTDKERDDGRYLTKTPIHASNRECPHQCQANMERWTTVVWMVHCVNHGEKPGGKAFTLLKIWSKHHLNWEGQKNDERNDAHRRIGNNRPSQNPPAPKEKSGNNRNVINRHVREDKDRDKRCALVKRGEWLPSLPTRGKRVEGIIKLKKARIRPRAPLVRSFQLVPLAPQHLVYLPRANSKTAPLPTASKVNQSRECRSMFPYPDTLEPKSNTRQHGHCIDEVTPDKGPR